MPPRIACKTGRLLLRAILDGSGPCLRATRAGRAGQAAPDHRCAHPRPRVAAADRRRRGQERRGARPRARGDARPHESAPELAAPGAGDPRVHRRSEGDGGLSASHRPPAPGHRRPGRPRRTAGPIPGACGRHGGPVVPCRAEGCGLTGWWLTGAGGHVRRAGAPRGSRRRAPPAHRGSGTRARRVAGDRDWPCGGTPRSCGRTRAA